MIGQDDMELYLYCSYTNARLGFCMSRLGSEKLEPVELKTTGADRQISDFFLCDRFRVLWMEYPPEDSSILLPEVEGGMFGMRSLRGEIGGRTGMANFMFRCGYRELPELEKLARGVLADPASFTSGLFARLSIGGECGYEADVNELGDMLETVRKRGEDEAATPVDQFISPSAAEKTLFLPKRFLRLAVYVTTWEQAAEQFKPRLLWQSCPKQAISEAQFMSLYQTRS